MKRRSLLLVIGFRKKKGMMVDEQSHGPSYCGCANTDYREKEKKTFPTTLG